ncbi:MAG: Fic family protein, partial [Bacteroidota bacterium]
LITYLYHDPLIDAQKAQIATGLSRPSVYKLIEELERRKILTEITGGKRGKMFLFKEYVSLFSS